MSEEKIIPEGSPVASGGPPKEPPASEKKLTYQDLYKKYGTYLSRDRVQIFGLNPLMRGLLPRFRNKN